MEKQVFIFRRWWEKEKRFLYFDLNSFRNYYDSPVGGKVVCQRDGDCLLFHDFLFELTDVKIMLEQVDFLIDEGRIGCYRPDEVKKILHQKKKDKLSRLAHRVSLGEL